MEALTLVQSNSSSVNEMESHDHEVYRGNSINYASMVKNAQNTVSPNSPIPNTSCAKPQKEDNPIEVDLDEEEDEDDDDGGKFISMNESIKGDTKSDEKKGGRRKINIEFIENKSRRHVTFSKRKAGLIKKAYELSTLTGTQVLLLVASETGNVYTFATPKLQPLITNPEGKTLIQACLNPPEQSEVQHSSSPPRTSGMSGTGHAHASHSYPPSQISSSGQSASNPQPIPQSMSTRVQDMYGTNSPGAEKKNGKVQQSMGDLNGYSFANAMQATANLQNLQNQAAAMQANAAMQNQAAQMQANAMQANANLQNLQNQQVHNAHNHGHGHGHSYANAAAAANLSMSAYGIRYHPYQSGYAAAAHAQSMQQQQQQQNSQSSNVHSPLVHSSVGYSYQLPPSLANYASNIPKGLEERSA
eukprot:TRINITY_DN2598_c0_g1_i2.p1 TRINITY_DN2598_c0_g1~~TRINITY_DN2598_c0_g1_i2.p1  ORF type:complete len:416 (+),score=118.82 TRINITY_DN2598_c0_g1_i2:164-1411(+)